MMYKLYAAFLMSLGIALALASDQAFGGPKGGVSASPHSTFHRSFARFHHFGRRRGDFFPGGVFWGGPFDDFSGPYGDQFNGAVAPPISGPITAPTSNDYTYKQDIPWDWAHRFPPGYFGSPAQPSSPAPAMAYVPGCAKQTVTVPGADGKDQTVNVVRC
jgi:hypothetical protein